METYRNFIDGQWLASTAKQTSTDDEARTSLQPFFAPFA